MSDTSFLPEDYLARKAERRTNLICLVLFVVVMAAVFGAFMVTNRQSTAVKAEQIAINTRYQTVATQIEELQKLETQKDEMLQKAELAAALVERVPRSILLAELINRMPEQLGLLEFEMHSEKIKAAAAPRPKNTTGQLAAPTRARTKAEAAAEQKKVETPRYRVTITMVGIAPTDLEVSRYIAELNSYELLQDVRLEYSEEKEMNDRWMRQFSIKAKLDPMADVRNIEPLHKQRRIKNPMTDQLQFNHGDGLGPMPTNDG